MNILRVSELNVGAMVMSDDVPRNGVMGQRDSATTSYFANRPVICLVLQSECELNLPSPSCPSRSGPPPSQAQLTFLLPSPQF